MKVKISLVNKIIIAITSSIVLFGILAIVFVYFYSKNYFLNSDIAHFKELFIEQTKETSLILNRASDLTRAISEDKLLADYLISPEKNKINKILENFNIYNIRGIYSAIYLMNKDGNTVVSTDESFNDQNYSFRDYFKQAMSGKSHIDFAIGVTSHESGYYFSHPVIAENGEILGVLVIKMVPDFINQSLETTDQSKSIMLIDKYGIVIYSSDNNNLFHSIIELSEQNKLDLKQKRVYENIDIKNLPYHIDSSILSTNKENISLDYIDKINQEEKFINISRVGNLNFFIVTEIDKSLYSSKAINLSLFLATFIFLAVLLAVLSVYLIIKNYLYLLTDLKKMADKLKSNDFNYRIIVNNNGSDLTDIAKSFNAAAESLQYNKTNTQDIITKRTKQLEKINKVMVGRELKMIELKNEIIALKNNKKIK